MDNNENLSNELLKQDGISPVGVSDTERTEFKTMLEAERKRAKRLAWIVQIPLWMFTISLLLLCVSERLLEALHIPFVAAGAALLLVAWIILFPLAFRFLARLKSTRARLRRLQKLMPGYTDKRKQTAIVIVGAKDGKRITKWPAVISLGIAVWIFTGLVSTGIYYLLARCWSPLLIMYSGLMSMVFVAACVYQGLKTPIEELTELKSTQPNILRTIMKSRITKFAAAAIVVLAVLVVIIIFGGSTEEPPNINVTKEGPPPKVEEQRILKKLHTELTEVRQMADVGDVKGLAAMLSAGQFESKLVAANFLAKMGGMPALETLTIHASGELILDSQAGNMRIRSTNSMDWLEIKADKLQVHTGQRILEAKRVRLTYDIRGDDEQWEKLQREFANMRQERADLERELAELGQSPPKDIDQLRKRLAKYNEMLDGMDEAIYVSIENGQAKLNCPFRHRTARAELRDGNVRVEWHGHIVEANSITLLLGLAPVRTDGPPPPVPDWRTRFDKVYSLDDEEVLRWVRYPFIPERQIYATQELRYYQSTDNPPPPGYLFFRLDGKLRNWTLSMGEGSLGLVLHDIGLKRYDYNDGLEKLSFLKLGGDWIARDNVPIEDKLLALERILQNELGRTIRFKKRKVNRDAIIVRGQYKRVPLKGVKHQDHIYIYTDLWEDFPGPEPVDGGGTRSVVKLIEMVGSHFNQSVVFETENLSDIKVSYFTSQSYSLAIANVKTREDKQKILDSVLNNLSKQTSLKFEYGRRDKDVWFITEQNKTK